MAVVPVMAATVGNALTVTVAVVLLAEPQTPLVTKAL